MGNILKRALVTSLRVLSDTGIEHPDAIITATNFGCLEYTERFLESMVENGEEIAKKTVNPKVGVYTKTHGYNTTYSQGRTSFELCILDAWMQMHSGMITTALVCGHDEMTEPVFEIQKRIGYVGVDGMAPCGEVAMSMMLNSSAEADHLCELAGVCICHKPTQGALQKQLDNLLERAGLALDDVSAVMTGKNGNPAHDKCYDAMLSSHLGGKPLLRYKHLFGENYTVPALGLYAASHCLKRGEVPEVVYDQATPARCKSLESILLMNLADGKDCTFILLKK